MQAIRAQGGFSTIIAMLLTAFLVVLSSGLLQVVLREKTISSSVYEGISWYAAAEGSLEYALIKAKHHKEWFEDAIRLEDDESELLFVNRSRTEILYEMDTSGKTYTGEIASAGFQIVPLFFDRGVLIGTNAKQPNKETMDTIVRTNTFLFQSDQPISWNLIGNDTSGNSVGLTGTGGPGVTVWNDSLATRKTGLKKSFGGTNGRISNQSDASIASFLRTYDNIYLVLHNPTNAVSKISISSDNGISFPRLEVRASSKIGKQEQTLRFSEDRAQFYDLFKYSLFN